jgi:hypothetical protein
MTRHELLGAFLMTLCATLVLLALWAFMALAFAVLG